MDRRADRDQTATVSNGRTSTLARIAGMSFSSPIGGYDAGDYDLLNREAARRGAGQQLKADWQILRGSEDRIHVRIKGFLLKYYKGIVIILFLAVLFLPFILPMALFRTACKRLGLGGIERLVMGCLGGAWLFLEGTASFTEYMSAIWTGALSLTTLIDEEPAGVLEAIGWASVTGLAAGAVLTALTSSEMYSVLRARASRLLKPFKRRELKQVAPSSDLDLGDEAAELARRAAMEGTTGSKRIDRDMQAVQRTDELHGLFPVGTIGSSGAPEVYSLNSRDYSTHGVVFGSTGSGKTETLKRLAWGLLEVGWDGIVVDLKEDVGRDGLRDWLYTYSQENDIPYQEIYTSKGDQNDYWMDACKDLREDEVQELILAFMAFDDAHWQSIIKNCLSQILKLAFMSHRLLPDKYGPVTMQRLYEMTIGIDDKNLNSVKNKYRPVIDDVRSKVPREEHPDLDVSFSRMLKPTSSDAMQFASLGAKLGTYLTTAAGRALFRESKMDDGTPRKELDVTQPGLIYVGAASTGQEDIAKYFAASVLQRLRLEIDRRNADRSQQSYKPRFVIVDEASIVDRKMCKAILSKGRSAGVSLILATQSPKDWNDENGQDFNTIMANVNVAVFMKQTDIDSAALCSKHIGTDQATVSASRTVDEHFTLVESQDQVIRDDVARFKPERIRNLGQGQAVVWVSMARENGGNSTIEVVGFHMIPMPGTVSDDIELPGRNSWEDTGPSGPAWPPGGPAHVPGGPHVPGPPGNPFESAPSQGLNSGPYEWETADPMTPTWPPPRG